MCTGNTSNPFCVAVIALLFIASLFLIVSWLLQEFAAGRGKNQT
jgi:flagellar biogenesis protein FliO